MHLTFGALVARNLPKGNEAGRPPLPLWALQSNVFSVSALKKTSVASPDDGWPLCRPGSTDQATVGQSVRQAGYELLNTARLFCYIVPIKR